MAVVNIDRKIIRRVVWLGIIADDLDEINIFVDRMQNATGELAAALNVLRNAPNETALRNAIKNRVDILQNP